MIASSPSIPHVSPACLDDETDRWVSVLGGCCFCPRPARPGSYYCDHCAVALWEELHRLPSTLPQAPHLSQIRANVLAHRTERRRRIVASPVLTKQIAIPLHLVLDRRLAGSRLPLRVWATLAAMGADSRAIPVNRRAVARANDCNTQSVNRAIRLLIDRGYLATELDGGRRLVRCVAKDEAL